MSGFKPTRLRAVAMGAVTHNAHLWHICEVSESNHVIRPLCRVKRAHLVNDGDVRDPTESECPTCRAKAARIAARDIAAMTADVMVVNLGVRP